MRHISFAPFRGCYSTWNRYPRLASWATFCRPSDSQLRPLERYVLSPSYSQLPLIGALRATAFGVVLCRQDTTFCAGLNLEVDVERTALKENTGLIRVFSGSFLAGVDRAERVKAARRAPEGLGLDGRASVIGWKQLGAWTLRPCSPATRRAGGGLGRGNTLP